jgi:hypothetical protein
MGVVIVPIMLNPKWFKRFVKRMGFYLFIPACAIPEWWLSMHEGLTVGL